MINKVSVIGAGQMGNGIAHVLAAAGIDVFLKDISQEQLDKVLKTIERNLKRQVGRGALSEGDIAKALTHIQPVTTDDHLPEVDLVIEAATENEEIKKQILSALGPQLKPEAIIATNTSSISVTRLAAITDRPEKFIGMHFMNPVPMMQLVEVIRALQTADTVLKATTDLAEQLGKVPVDVKDAPGFVANRILLPMINEAVFVLGQSTAGIEDIDKGCRLGLNHPMGPLQLADFVGLDTCLDIMTVLYRTTRDSKYRPAPLLVKYVEAGWLGRKAKRGFYDYRGDTPVPTR